MSTTQESTSLPVVSTDEITAARDHNRTQIHHGLNAAWNLIQALPDEARAQAEQALTVAFDNAEIMAARWSETQELLMRTVALAGAQQMALEEVTTQRIQATNELQALVKAIKERNLNHPAIMGFYRKLYQEVMESHNEAFWSSLPYDIADTMGPEWSHTEADVLYDLITNEELDDEGFAEDYGTTPEKVREARARLLAVIREFDQSRGDE